MIVLSTWRENSINSYYYLIENFPNLIKIEDRLGKNILHYIFQYDLHECLQIKDELFSQEDFKVK